MEPSSIMELSSTDEYLRATVSQFSGYDWSLPLEHWLAIEVETDAEDRAFVLQMQEPQRLAFYQINPESSSK